jgi:putative cell wall-binding protein
MQHCVQICICCSLELLAALQCISQAAQVANLEHHDTVTVVTVTNDKPIDSDCMLT